jgi:predicted dehydrogenase
VLDKDNIIHLDCNEGIFKIDSCEIIPEAVKLIPGDDRRIHGDHAFAAIPNCLNALSESFRKGVPAETSGEDNLKTMELVFAAIRSQDTNQTINMK